MMVKNNRQLRNLIFEQIESFKEEYDEYRYNLMKPMSKSFN